MKFNINIFIWTWVKCTYFIFSMGPIYIDYMLYGIPYTYFIFSMGPIYIYYMLYCIFYMCICLFDRDLDFRTQLPRISRNYDFSKIKKNWFFKFLKKIQKIKKNIFWKPTNSRSLSPKIKVPIKEAYTHIKYAI